MSTNKRWSVTGSVCLRVCVSLLSDCVLTTEEAVVTLLPRGSAASVLLPTLAEISIQNRRNLEDPGGARTDPCLDRRLFECFRNLWEQKGKVVFRALTQFQSWVGRTCSDVNVSEGKASDGPQHLRP